MDPRVPQLQSRAYSPLLSAYATRLLHAATAPPMRAIEHQAAGYGGW